jgi:hypothetical protein
MGIPPKILDSGRKKRRQKRIPEFLNFGILEFPSMRGNSVGRTLFPQAAVPTAASCLKHPLSMYRGKRGDHEMGMNGLKQPL